MNAAAFALLMIQGIEQIPADLYSCLPSETVCKQRFDMASSHLYEIDKALDFYCGNDSTHWGEGAIRTGGGTAYHCLSPLRDRAKLYRDFWWACWWVRWPQATEENRIEWADRARELLGHWAFSHASQIPPIPPEQIPVAP